MKNKKNALIKILLAVALAVGSIGVIGCGKSKNPQTNKPQGETGIYYYSATEDEYQLSLDGKRFSLTIDNELKTGTYVYDGATLNLYVEGEESLVGSITDNVLTVTYNGGAYRFYKKVSYTVSYEANGGSAVAATKVINGKTLDKPADPVKKGYDFIGWYKDSGYTQPFAFNSEIVTADVTLYARFVEKSATSYEYVATMLADGKAWDAKTTIGGVLYDLPTLEREGDTFAGWWVSDYQSADKLTYKYEGQTLTQDVNLYPVWESEGIQVSVSETGIAWSALMTGVEYTVAVSSGNDYVTSPQTTTALTMEYDFSELPAGDYTVSVTADGKTTVAYYKNKALDRVSGFSVVAPAVLRFNPVANATNYYVTVSCGDKEHVHTLQDNGNSTKFSFANCSMQAGGIAFTVVARGNGYLESVSETFVFNRQLDAVENVNYNAGKGVLTWSAVDKAISYQVDVTVGDTTDTYVVNTASLSLKEYAGDVSVKVTALANGYNSAEGTVYSYTNANLAAPKAKLNYNKITWNEVAGATGYVVLLDSKEYTVEAGATEFTIPDSYALTGLSFAVAVKAVSENATSLYSQELDVTYGEFGTVLYTDGAVRWSPVGGAYSYDVNVNGVLVAELNGDASAAKVVFDRAGTNVIIITAYDFYKRMLDQNSVNVLANEIIFDTRGGSAVGSVFVANGDEIIFPETTKEGCVFAGWYNVPDGPKSNGAKYEDKYFSGMGRLLLYAYWTPQPFEVTLRAARTILDPFGRPKVIYENVGTHTVYYNQPYTLPVVESIDNAKVFGGWFEDDSTSSLRYTNPLGESVFNWSLLEDKVLYVGWIEILAYEKYQDVDGEAFRVTRGAGVEYVKEITVPAAYTDPVTGETLPVWSIGTGAFANCTRLETLNIPDTLKSIFLAFGSTTSTMSTGSALYECRKLKNINVYCVDEDGVHDEYSNHETYYQSIDGLLIRHASPTTSTLEYGVELAFIPFAKRGTLVVPDVVQHIPMRTFYNLDLDTVVIPHTVIRIGERAFYRSTCKTIIFEEAPAGVDEKPLSLSEGCLNVLPNLTELVLPARIGLFDFHGQALLRQNESLTKVHVEGKPAPEQGNNYYSSIDGVICNYNKTKLVYYPSWRKGSYTIPVEIQVIGEGAFRHVQYLDEVIIKDNVVRIESNAFLDCSTIKSVVFDYDRGSLSIEAKAFYGCTGLKSLSLPAQLEYVGSQAFGNTPSLTSVNIDGSADTVFEEKAFADDSGSGYVSSVYMSATAPAFEINKVFYGCKIYLLDIDKNNQNFYVDAQSVLYNKDATKILYYPFGLTENYVIPSTVTEIGEGVFENRANITSIHIPAQVTKISARAFKGCTGLQEVTFAERTSNLVIEDLAFEGCLSLESISLPEGITTLTNPVFVGCASLNTLYLPASLTDLDFAVAFDGCKRLLNITVAEDNAAFTILDGIFYAKEVVDGKAVPVSILYAPKDLKGDLVIPSTVSNISAGVFKGYTGITSISFENDEVLYGLELGESVFAEMTSLKSVRLPDGLFAIPVNAFRGSALQSVYVPNSVEELHKGAFAECMKLTTVTFEEGDLALLMGSGGYKDGIFYNTKSLKEITLPDRLTMIPSYMFSNSAITTVDFPANLILISTGAFINCTNLTAFDMPDTVEVLGSFVFSGCTSLKTATLSDSLTSIPNYLFGRAPQGARGSSVAIQGGEEEGGSSDGGRNDGGRSIIEIDSKRAGIIDDIGKDDDSGSGSIIDTNPILTPVISGPTENVVAATALTSIVIPEFVETIGAYAFNGCTSLAAVQFASTENVTSFGSYAFADSGITAMDMPDSVETLGDNVFACCPELATLTISDAVTVIPQHMCSSVVDYTSDGFGEVKGALTKLKSIVIPAGVTTINAYAFYMCGIETLTFEEGNAINQIESGAFEYSAIKSLTLPAAASGKTTLAINSFKDCDQLKDVSLPNTLSEGLATAFIGCSSIESFAIESDGDNDVTNDIYNVDAENLVVYNGDKTEIRLYLGTSETFTVPENVTKIHYNAFRGNTNLKYISFPKSLQIIEDAAFAFCTSLVTATFPADSQLNTIGFRAFAFSGIQEITIPQGVTSMGAHTYKLGNPTNVDFSQYRINSQVAQGWDATSASAGWNGRVFEECASLKTVNVLTTTLCSNMFAYCSALESVTLNPNTNMFRGYTFINCSSLKSIELPKALSFVGVQEFMGCGLTSIHLPAGIQLNTTAFGTRAYGANMFAECSNLETVTMDDSYTTIAYAMFAGTAIKSFKMPANIKTIGSNAFFLCDQLEEVIFPESFVGNLSIGENAFADAHLLKGGFDFSSIPTVTMEPSAFLNCKNLEWIKLPDSFTDVKRMVFYGCEKLENVEAKNIQTVGWGAFFDCHALKELTLSANATTIENQAFSNCYSLQTMLIPDTVSTIGEQAFMNTGITTLDLGNGVIELLPYAFYGTKISTVHIPASLGYIDFTAFLACENLEYYTVDPANASYKVGDFGELYNAENFLIGFPCANKADNGVFVMPMTSMLSDYAFYGAKYLTAVELSPAVSYIAVGAFENSSITRIELTSNVMEICDFAFKNCTQLMAIRIPSTVTWIGESAFEGCSSLVELELPKHITEILPFTFKGCSSLTSVVIPTDVELIQQGAFEGCGLVSIVIPETVTTLGTLSEFKGTIIMEGAVFANCVDLQSVVFEGNTKVYMDMFAGCTSLTSVTFAEGWTEIAEGMFTGCTALSIELPASVETIGENAFAGWTAEQTITINITLEKANELWGEGWNGEATVVVK